MLQAEGVGSIAFSPLAGGQLTNRYLNGIPPDSRAASNSRFYSRNSSPPSGWKKSANLTPLPGAVDRSSHRWR